ncbi:ATP-binding cassette domain-containing protein [Ferviditalea candida]|uniref:ATP-binding cassette domain-containing protein n=1 Tax=Ferviditalea candida TaxID=3108399 RepID=UPI00352FA2A5
MNTVTSLKSSIQFTDVTKKFRNGSNFTTVLRNISGEVPTGTILTLVGPSGAGKSTLLSLCNLLISLDSGEVFVKTSCISFK